jgi:hypothetical protein
MRHTWWVDATAVLTLIAACLTLESGVLVWVALVAGRLAGRRGVSDRALLCVTVLMAVYLVVRLTMLPLDTQNASGYLTERLEPEQIRQRFGPASALQHLYGVGIDVGGTLLGAARRHDCGVASVGSRRHSSAHVDQHRVMVIHDGADRHRCVATVAFGVVPPANLTATTCGRISSSSRRAGSQRGRLVRNTQGRHHEFGCACYALVAFWAVRDQLNRVRRDGAAIAMAAVLLAAMFTVGGARDRCAPCVADARHSPFTTIGPRCVITFRKIQWGIASSRRCAPTRSPGPSSTLFVPRWADRVFDIDY